MSNPVIAPVPLARADGYSSQVSNRVRLVLGVIAVKVRGIGSRQVFASINTGRVGAKMEIASGQIQQTGSIGEISHTRRKWRGATIYPAAAETICCIVKYYAVRQVTGIRSIAIRLPH